MVYNMDKEKESYEKDCEVDKYNLHTELEILPGLIAKWRKKYAMADGVLEKIYADMPILKAELKTEYEISLAKIEFDLRENWTQYCPDVKLTEGSVSNKLKMSPKYEEANKKYIAENLKLSEELACAVEDKGVLYGACRALESKETSLTKLVKLYLSGYYDSQNKVSTGLEKEVQKTTSENIRRNLKIKRTVKE